MPALIVTTLIWGFSFTLIGSVLKGIDPFFVAALRLGLAFGCFLPFVRLDRVRGNGRWLLLGIGALQFGCMYVAYLSAFRYAPTYMVALFSSFTPLWISLMGAFLKPASLPRLLLAGGLATAGAVLIRSGNEPEGASIWTAFVLMQISNICFGGGQLAYRAWKLRHPDLRERDHFAWLYLGGFLLALLFTLSRLLPAGKLPEISLLQGGVILYLGLIASGLGFFLWNYGASRVSTAALAAANNLVVPLGVLIALLFGGDQPDWALFLPGAACIAAALALAPRQPGKRPAA
jgi:drug/metabolite transporter (DMT)-like permease